MTIGRRFLPERVNLGFPAFLDDLSEARRFDFEKFHVGRDGPPGRPFFRVVARPVRRLPDALLKKSAREPRQGGSDYRCCIPALAGFVRPPSIAPDGEEKFAQDRHRAIGFLKIEDVPGVNRRALLVASPA